MLPVNAQAHIVLASFIVNLVAARNWSRSSIGLYIRERAPSRGAAADQGRHDRVDRWLPRARASVALRRRWVQRLSRSYGSRGLMAILLIVVLSAATGWLFGGSEVHYRNTMTLSTIMRNFGLALLVTGQKFVGYDCEPNRLDVLRHSVDLSRICSRRCLNGNNLRRRPNLTPRPLRRPAKNKPHLEGRWARGGWRSNFRAGRLPAAGLT